MTTKSDLDLFYSLMTQLAEITNGMKLLSNCDGQMPWPTRGAYFFFEKDEIRQNGDMRVVRVGTHALKTGSKTTLWNRLRQHRGNIGGVHPGGGNHRGSIFRLHVGTAIISKEQKDIPTCFYLSLGFDTHVIRLQAARVRKHSSGHYSYILN